MADLRTDYKDDVLNINTNERRKYRMINNADGTISFEDVTDYVQNGDSFGATDVNTITEKVNSCLTRQDVVDNLESTATDLPLSANMGAKLDDKIINGINVLTANVYANISANTRYDYTMALTPEQQEYGGLIVAVGYGTDTGAGQAIPVQCYRRGDNVVLGLYNPSASAIPNTTRQSYLLYFFKYATRRS